MVTGYLILDLEKVNLNYTEKKQLTKNQFERLESNIGKVILLTNIVVNGDKRPNMFSYITHTEDVGSEYKIYIRFSTSYQGKFSNTLIIDNKSKVILSSES